MNSPILEEKYRVQRKLSEEARGAEDYLDKAAKDVARIECKYKIKFLVSPREGRTRGGGIADFRFEIAEGKRGISNIEQGVANVEGKRQDLKFKIEN